jgi:hypothetical protein
MSAALSERVGKVVGYPPLSEMDEQQRREFQEALLDADSFEELPGKWQAAVLAADRTGRSSASLHATRPHSRRRSHRCRARPGRSKGHRY